LTVLFELVHLLKPAELIRGKKGDVPEKAQQNIDL
jgi:hypothetical protein